MALYAKHVSRRNTSQSRKADPRQVKNSAGGFVFQIDDFARLERFLILGAEGGTYYSGEAELTIQNAACLSRCLDTDGARAIKMICDMSTSGRAPKNDAAVFALAVAAAHPSDEVRKAALSALTKVCRTGTHLFQFAASVDELRGWGRGLRKAVSSWYNEKDSGRLAYQLVKYRQRGGWSHRDVMRLAHPDPKHAALYRWVTARDQMGERKVERKDGQSSTYAAQAIPEYIEAFEKLQHPGTSRSEVIQLIGDHGFTHEMVPGAHKNDPKVWEALLVKMPLTALIRHLGKLSSVGLMKPFSGHAKEIAARLTDQVALSKARIHPLAVLTAQRTYQSGHGLKGSLKWSVNQKVLGALEEAFYLAFDAVEPSGKNTMVALDVSGSMDFYKIAGSPLTPREASAAMALVTMRTEPETYLTAFHHGIEPLDISPKLSLGAFVKKVSGLPFGATDCAQPMLHAIKENLEVDTFVVYTDNETWFGKTHPYQALQQYRQKSGRNTKLVVVGMTATKFSIADPNDAGMLDVVGFDSAAPSLIADFARQSQ